MIIRFQQPPTHRWRSHGAVPACSEHHHLLIRRHHLEATPGRPGLKRSIVAHLQLAAGRPRSWITRCLLLVCGESAFRSSNVARRARRQAMPTRWWQQGRTADAHRLDMGQKGFKSETSAAETARPPVLPATLVEVGNNRPVRARATAQGRGVVQPMLPMPMTSTLTGRSERWSACPRHSVKRDHPSTEEIIINVRDWLVGRLSAARRVISTRSIRDHPWS